MAKPHRHILRAQTYQIWQLQQRRPQTIVRQSTAVHSDHTTADSIKPMVRNALKPAQTDQIAPSVAARLRSCAAAQRDNAKERDVLVASEAVGHQQGRREAAAHDGAAGWVVQGRAAGVRQRQPSRSNDSRRTLVAANRATWRRSEGQSEPK